MVSSISSTAEDSIQLIMAQLLQKMNAADKDGIKGLSKDELSSVNAGGDLGGSAFLKSLSEKFESLDTDGNGQLSEDEISLAAPPKGPMGPPPGMSIAGSVESTDSTSSKESAKDLIAKLMESFVESFTATFSKDNTKAADDASKTANSLESTADTDKSGGLSLDELSTAVKGSSSGQAGLINDFIKNFDSYDVNGDGQLSISEMTEAIPKKQFSQQELAAMSDSLKGANNLGSSLGSLSGSFVQKLLNNYQNVSASGLTSSVSVAG